MNELDMTRQGLHAGDLVILSTAVNDGVTRQVGGLEMLSYDIPQSCIAGHYPECNVLVPLWHHAKVPAAKSVPVRISLQHRSP